MHDIWKYMVSSDVVGLSDINTCNEFLPAQNKYPATRFTCHNLKNPKRYKMMIKRYK